MSDSDDHSEDRTRVSPQHDGTSRKGTGWSEEEHKMFLKGLAALGKGNWRGISKLYVKTRTPTQVASHAQKYFLRLSGCCKRKSRFTSIEQKMGPPPLDHIEEATIKTVPRLPSSAPMDYLTAAALPLLHRLQQQHNIKMQAMHEASPRAVQQQSPQKHHVADLPPHANNVAYHEHVAQLSSMQMAYAGNPLNAPASIDGPSHQRPVDRAAAPVPFLPRHPTTTTAVPVNSNGSSGSVLSISRLFEPMTTEEAREMGLATSGLVYQPEPEPSSFRSTRSTLSLFDKTSPPNPPHQMSQSGGQVPLMPGGHGGYMPLPVPVRQY